jgi:hypothetical protein
VIDKTKFRVRLDPDQIRFEIYHRGHGWGEYGYAYLDERPYQARLPDAEIVGTTNRLCDLLPLIIDHYENEWLAHRRRELTHNKELARSLPIEWPDL